VTIYGAPSSTSVITRKRQMLFNLFLILFFKVQYCFCLTLDFYRTLLIELVKAKSDHLRRRSLKPKDTAVGGRF